MKNILVVDDNTISRFWIRRTLMRKERYFRLYIAGSGGEAQRAIISFYGKFKKLPDIIMVSVSPAVIGIIDFVQLFSKINMDGQWHRKIIVLSLPANSHYPLSEDEKPIIHYFPKPLDKETLGKILSL